MVLRYDPLRVDVESIHALDLPEALARARAASADADDRWNRAEVDFPDEDPMILAQVGDLCREVVAAIEERIARLRGEA